MNVKGQITKGYKHRKVATHCKYGHEFTEENTYTPPNTTKRCCVTCRRRIVEEYNIRNKDKKNAKRRRWRKEFETSEMKRENNLRWIGWSTEMFNSVFEEQNGLCAICKKALTMEKKISGSRACADHEHIKPPKPRGILCANCNLGIGNLQDDPVIMQAALEYIRKFI